MPRISPNASFYGEDECLSGTQYLMFSMNKDS